MLLRIGSAAAELVLTESLLDGDTVLRFRVLTALNKLRAAGSSRPLDVKLVETVLAAEVVGHLRSYQILGTLDYAADSSEPVAQALRESMTQEVERIFRLVKLLSPVYDLESAYVGLQSVEARHPRQRAGVPREHPEAAAAGAAAAAARQRRQRASSASQLANRTLGTTVATREEAAALLAESGDPWLQSCAAYAIGTLHLGTLAHYLDRWVDAPDPLLRETARQAPGDGRPSTRRGNERASQLGRRAAVESATQPCRQPRRCSRARAIMSRSRTASRGAWPPMSLLKYANTSRPDACSPSSQSAQGCSSSSP